MLIFTYIVLDIPPDMMYYLKCIKGGINPMKKLISALLAAAVILTACVLPASAASDIEYPDNFQLTSFDNDVGDGANDQWGTLSGGDNGKYENGTNMFTEGTKSAGIYISYRDHLSFFHNFVWNEDGALIKAEPTQNVAKEGLDIIGNGYKYVEFDVASKYDVVAGTFSFCLCGSTDAWHGYDQVRNNAEFKAGTWYHVAMRIEDFVFQPDIFSPNPDVPDPSSAYQHSKYGLSCAQRMRLEINYAYDPATGDVPEELYFNIDDLRITKYDQPLKEDTMVYQRPVFVYRGDDEATLVEYNGTGNSVILPESIVTIEDNVFGSKTDLVKVEARNATKIASIGDNNFESLENVVVYGFGGSYLETYCNENGVAFVDYNNRPGDVDGNTEVTGTDALKALQASVQMLSLDEAQFARADIDGDGSVTANDALKILQYSVGMIINF